MESLIAEMCRCIRSGLSTAVSMTTRQKTLTFQEVPLLFRDAHIHSGFRPPYKSWSYYLFSIFQIHNETINVWSHLLAIFLFIIKMHQISDGMTLTSPESLVILGFGVAAVIYTLLSTCAHLFHSKSEKVHYTCFQLDYIGIAIYGHGTGLLLYYTAGTEAYYKTVSLTRFICCLTLFSLSVCIGSGYAKLRYTRPYPFQRKLWQLGTNGIQVFFITLPLFYRISECKNIEKCMGELWPHCRYLVWLIVSTAFFASHLPEKWYPGNFDIVGNGHQLFHFFITYTTLLQFDAGVIELNRPDAPLNRPLPNILTVFGSMFVVISVGLLAVVLKRPMLKRSITRDRSLCPLNKQS